MAEPVKSPWSSVKRTASQTRWQSVTLQSNTVTSKVSYRTNSFVELGAGLNITNAQGQFVSANPSFTITPTGAAATGTVHRVIVPGDIGSGEGVKVITPGGEELVFQPLAIDYFDPVDGQGVLLDVVTNAVGWLVASNEIVFSNCFTHIKASIRLRNTRAGLESDLVLHESPPEPQTFGLSSSARLEMLTEQLAGPRPSQRSSVLREERDPLKAAAMLEPHLVDTELTFGTMKMGAGRAFITPATTNVPPAARSGRVAKSFLEFDNRKIIIEAVEHRRVRPALLLLPPATKAVRQAGLAPLLKAERLAKNTRRLPALPVSGETREAALRNKKAQPVQHARLPSQDDATVQLASAAPAPAFVLDYYLVGIYGETDFTFRSDETYLVSCSIGLSGTTTIEGGTVIKFSEASGLFFFEEYDLVCDTTEHLPAVFTSIDDDSVGEDIGSGSPVMLGTWGLYFISGGSRALSNVRFTWLSNPIAMEGGGSANALTLRNVQVREADYVVDAGGTDMSFYNGLFVNCGSLFMGGDAFVGQHLTIDTASAVGSSANSATLKNSLLVDVTDPDGDITSYTATDTTTTSDNSVFTTVEGGEHYLAANSTLRNAGTTTGLDVQLLASLPNLTTYAPEEITGTLSTDRTLSRRAIRDTDADGLDRGYHYPAVDYLVRNVTVENATLKMQNGVVVAGAFDSSWSALKLAPGKLISQGTATRLNHLLRASQVQENVQERGYTLLQDGPLDGSFKPEITCRFTVISSLAGESFGAFIYQDAHRVEFSHSTFYNAGLGFNLYGGGNQNVGLTNNLFLHRALYVTANSPAYFSAYNNLLKDSELILYGDTGAWQIFDNVFDHTTIFEQVDQFGNDIVYDNNPEAMGHNAFVGTDHQLSSLNDSFYESSITYDASGPLGRYYVSGTTLENLGSRDADEAGLFHFTTQASLESIEEDSVVDIGLHYPSVAANSSPYDADADGLADYLEDSSGNGAAEAADFADFSKWDTDNDGLSDLQEYQLTTTPRTPNSRLDAYEGVVDAQTPNGWFKLNNSLGNKVSGRASLGSSGTGVGYENDVFAVGNGAYSFAAASGKLTLTDGSPVDDPLGGGTDDAVPQGSLTLLFCALNGQPVAARYLLSQGTDVTTTDGNALAVYADDDGLKLRVGPVEQTILADASIARGAWYYLAVTSDEERADNEVRWYLARVGSDTLQSGSLTLGLKKEFGNNGVITLGNQEGSTTGAYYWDVGGTAPKPRNGHLDQIAFWNRELAASEITAQFDALPQSDLPNHFDLSKWEIRLPVNKLNGLGGTPLEISAGWLNSDFEYVNPSTPYTKEYFYLGADNTLVFEAPWNGADTDGSGNSPRSELRETKTDGMEHNWKPYDSTTGIGTHTLLGSCKIVSGSTKTVIGQIHAKSPDDSTAAVILYYEGSSTSTKKLRFSVYFNPLKTIPSGETKADRHYDLISNVQLNDVIDYQIEMVGMSGGAVELEVKVTVNPGTTGETTFTQPVPMTDAPFSGWGNSDVTLYYKAGCYYPKATSTSGTAIVAFSSLEVTHEE